MAEHIAENKAYYNQRFGALSQSLNEEETRRWHYLSKNIDILSLPKDAAIADFGCGRGWLSNKLSAYGQVTGFDLSEQAVANASQHFKQCNFVCLNAEELLRPQFLHAFDLVVSSEVIEHTEDQAQYLQNSAALLKKGGSLILSTPNGKWKNAFYQNGREQWQQPIENWRSAEELSLLVKNAGFTNIQVQSFNSEWIFDFRPEPFSFLSHPLHRKYLKLIRKYTSTIERLNKNDGGLNLLVLAKKL